MLWPPLRANSHKEVSTWCSAQRGQTLSTPHGARWMKLRGWLPNLPLTARRDEGLSVSLVRSRFGSRQRSRDQFYDVGKKYLVMEFVDGAPIGAPDSTWELLEQAVQIADGFSTAHAAGSVHQDLKPAIILITGPGSGDPGRNAGKLADVDYERDHKTPGNSDRVGIPESAGSCSRNGICLEGVLERENAVRLDRRRDSPATEPVALGQGGLDLRHHAERLVRFPWAGGGAGSAMRTPRKKSRDQHTNATTSTGPQVTWKATVRWESALPVREALHRGAPGKLPEDYILNVFGEVPGADPDSGFAILKDNTTLEHKGDQIKLNRVELAPGNSVSEAGTLFYFSRLLALKLEDKEAIFTTKLGPLKVKCKFTLKDMLYRGNLEL